MGVGAGVRVQSHVPGRGSDDAVGLQDANRMLSAVASCALLQISFLPINFRRQQKYLKVCVLMKLSGRLNVFLPTRNYKVSLDVPVYKYKDL